MYVPDSSAQPDRDRISALIAAHPLGTLVTRRGDDMTANLIPFVLDPTGGPHGVLIGHVARANPLWHEDQHDGHSIVVFTGPDAYISPSWYPSKTETHEVVPTWNYLVVQATGPLLVHDDERWIRGAVGRLTKAMERTRPDPWKMADAPPAFTSRMLGNIVGIELPIEQLTGKWKAGQNRSLADREGAARGLYEEGQMAGIEMADVMTEGDRSRRSNLSD